MPQHVEQLEREAEHTRLQLSNTLSELRGRLTPGQILDEVTGFGADGTGAEFVRNLGRDIARNPLPVAFAGAGLAWLMLARNTANGDASNGHAGAHHGARHAPTGRLAASAMETASGFATAAAETADEAKRGVAAGADGLRDGLSAAADSVGSTARSIGEATASTYRSAAARTHDMRDAIGANARAVADRARETGQGLTALCREQPLMLAGLGVAIGALIGALLPATGTEDRLVGRTADQLKDDAAAMARETEDMAKGALAEARPAAGEEAVAHADGSAQDGIARAQTGPAAQDRAADDASEVPPAARGPLPTGGVTGLT